MPLPWGPDSSVIRLPLVWAIHHCLCSRVNSSSLKSSFIVFKLIVVALYHRKYSQSPQIKQVLIRVSAYVMPDLIGHPLLVMPGPDRASLRLRSSAGWGGGGSGAGAPPSSRPGAFGSVRPFGAIPPTSLRLWAPPAHEATGGPAARRPPAISDYGSVLQHAYCQPLVMPDPIGHPIPRHARPRPGISSQ